MSVNRLGDWDGEDRVMWRHKDNVGFANPPAWKKSLKRIERSERADRERKKGLMEDLLDKEAKRVIPRQECVVEAWYARWALKRFATALERQGQLAGAERVRRFLNNAVKPYARGEF